MADIAKAGLTNTVAQQYGTKDVRMFQADDPVYFETDNVPLKNLAYRDSVLEGVQNAIVDEINAARGTAADLATRLATALNDDGTIKDGAIPDLTALENEIIAARNGQASLDEKIDQMDGFDAVLNLELDRTQLAAGFEASAEQIRSVTPSGFSDSGHYSAGGVTTVLSGFDGISVNGGTSNVVYLGEGRLSEQGTTVIPGKPNRAAEVVVTGHKLKLLELSGDGNHAEVIFPTPPASGTRQDLAFLEVWKEEVSKDDGLFFAYGNTQFASSAAVDGLNGTQTPAAYSGSAYFTPSSGVYAVEASSAPDAFIQNPDHKPYPAGIFARISI